MDPTFANDLFGLANRTVLVTGVFGGLGIELVSSLLQAGADVVGTDMLTNPEDSESWKSMQELAESRGLHLLYRIMDITNEDSVSFIFENIKLRHPLRGVVCGAELFMSGNALEFSASDIRKVVDFNVTGTFLTARVAAKSFQKTDVTGSIVVIASMSGHISNKGLDSTAYNVSKAALHQLARSLAVEWGRSNQPIRVNTISPGYIMTETQVAKKTSKEVPHARGTWPEENTLGRLSKPSEYRAPVLFLLSDGSSYVTGSDVRVDGGHCAW